MLASEGQRLRLLKLLQLLEKKETGDVETIAAANKRALNFDHMGFENQEHRDIVTLHSASMIHSNQIRDPRNQITSAGIFAFQLTNDGRAFLNENRALLIPNISERQNTNGVQGGGRVFIIHGTDRDGYVQDVEALCRQHKLVPVRMMEEPNYGQTLPEKLMSSMASADYFVAVLTADEEGPDGTKRARINAYGETMAIAVQSRPKLAVLREEGVEIPTNLQGLTYIPLAGQWSIKLTAEFHAAGLI